MKKLAIETKGELAGDEAMHTISSLEGECRRWYGLLREVMAARFGEHEGGFGKETKAEQVFERIRKADEAAWRALAENAGQPEETSPRKEGTK
jgi:hypothetical protein